MQDRELIRALLRHATVREYDSGMDSEARSSWVRYWNKDACKNISPLRHDVCIGSHLTDGHQTKGGL